MSAPVDLFVTVHLVLQFGFIGVTFLLMLMTIVNRVRVRGILMTWRQGRFFGLPLLPLAFIGAVAFFFGITLVTGEDIPFTPFVGYLVGGSFWFTSGLLANGLHVSRYGLIHNVNHGDESIAWGQIVDYFVTPPLKTLPPLAEKAAPTEIPKKQQYVFFYFDEMHTRHRLEIAVPPAQRERFAEIVRDRLDARFDLSLQRVYGKKALEG